MYAAGRKIDGKLHILFRRHLMETLIIVNEHKARSFHPTGHTGGAYRNRPSAGTLVGDGRRHVGKLCAPVLQKEVNETEMMILWTNLAV